MREWISVKEGVPRTNKEHSESAEVLVCIGESGIMAVCWYNSQKDSFCISHHYAKSDAVSGVTHWMPLPASPYSEAD